MGGALTRFTFLQGSVVKSTAIQIGGVSQYKLEAYIVILFLRSSGAWGLRHSSESEPAGSGPIPKNLI